METKKEEQKLTKKQKMALLGLAVGSGIVYAIGYKFGFRDGDRYAEECIGKGIEKCWEFDPTLKEHMWDTMFKVMKTK